MGRLGDGEVAEIFNAFQYGFLIKCLLNEEFESIAMAMERSRPALKNRYTSGNSWLQTYLKQQNPFQEMKPHIEKVKDVIADTTTKLERASTDFDFDTEMLKTGPYIATIDRGTGENPSTDGSLLLSRSSRPSVAQSSSSTIDARSYFTAPTSHYPRLADTLLTDGGLHVNKVRPRICIYDDSDGAQRKAWSVRAKTYAVDSIVVRLGNKSTLEVTLVVRLEWKFEEKDLVYSSLFYEVPELAEDIVIGRESIFEHELFIAHPEFCTISQAGDGDDSTGAPSLTILDFVTQRKGKVERATSSLAADVDFSAEEREAQEKRAREKESANRAQREREREDALRQQLKKHQLPSSSGTSQSESGSGKKGS
ncbi:hypothetical protein Q7P37_008640 [Cladosporium fusiforme]